MAWADWESVRGLGLGWGLAGASGLGGKEEHQLQAWSRGLVSSRGLGPCRGLLLSRDLGLSRGLWLGKGMWLSRGLRPGRGARGLGLSRGLTGAWQGPGA